jgi:2,4-dienoyl-CoA reductase (NADPH2)
MTAASGSAYPHLLEALDLGFIKLRNRALMGSMHLALEECANGFSRLAAFYAARARGGVGLIVTGGYAPNAEARGKPDGVALISSHDVAMHKQVPEAVHAEGGLIAAQLLHTGRYAYHDHGVGPSAIQAPINPFVPRPLSSQEVNQTIEDFAVASARAREAGYDGVEIMGSEGYLINQFLARHTNQRTDEWGGAYDNRKRLPVEIVRRTRERVGDDFLIVYRLSMLDLVPDGSTLDEVIGLGQAVEAAGANIINTGIGWHEARIPTIATLVPRAAFTRTTTRCRSSAREPSPMSSSPYRTSLRTPSTESS